MNESAFGSYLRAIRSHPFVVVLVTLAVLAGAVAWLALRPASYEATAQVLVTPLAQDDQNFIGLEVLRDSGDPTRTVQTAATLVQSQAAADAAAKRLGAGQSGGDVFDSVTVEPQGESNVLAIKATASDPQLATRTANAFARAALGLRDEALRRQIGSALTQARDRIKGQPTGGPEATELAQRIGELEAARRQGDPTLSISSPAATGERVGAGPPVVLFLALIAGLALGSGVAVLMELFERRVRTEEELLTLFQLPVLARVPKLGRRQRRPPARGLPWYMPPGIREGFRTLITQITRSDDVSRAIMVTSASTGDGKTTSAVNLAVALAASGRRVVLLDFDIRKPEVGPLLGMEVTSGLMELLSSESSLRSLLRPAPHLPALTVLPTGIAQGDSALVEATNMRLPEFVDEARKLADYVVVDTAPLGEVSDALPLTPSVDDILVVARPGHTNRANLIQMRDLLQRGEQLPAGLLLIGEAAGVSSNYYGYGMSNRPLTSESKVVQKSRS